MEIIVSDIEGSQNISYDESDFSFLSSFEEGASSGMIIEEPVKVDITVEKQQDQFYLNGTLKGNMTLTCSRCLEKYTLTIDNEFSITLIHGENEFIDVHEIELTEQDLKTDQFSGGELDITRIVQEQVALLYPMKPLCREGCKGLCSQCGNNLNEGECGCERKETDSPFAILKDLNNAD